jgi:hypothetical protein
MKSAYVDAICCYVDHYEAGDRQLLCHMLTSRQLLCSRIAAEAAAIPSEMVTGPTCNYSL